MRSVDEIIRQAIEEGKFDHLAGKGQKLNLDENPFENPDWSAAHHLLHSNGFTLPWIEKRQQIEADLEQARGDLQRAWQHRQKSLEAGRLTPAIEARWQQVEATFRQKVEVLNQRIAGYNLETPADQFQRLPVNADLEVEAARAAKPSAG